MIPSTDQLRSKAIRLTHQRIGVLEFLKGCTDHPSAVQLFKALKTNMPSLSKTTLYNTLRAFAEAGLVSSVSIPGEETRYEYKTSPHCHFLCKDCGGLTDLMFTCGNVGTLELQGYRVDEIIGCFKGSCGECQKKDTGTNRAGRFPCGRNGGCHDES
jgi:Fur family transcriptional regulator, peroxide stress response regulator